MEELLPSGRQKAILGRNGPKNPTSSQETYLDSMEETENEGAKPCETWNRSRKSLEEFCQRKRSLVEFRAIAHESSYQERPFCKIRPVLSPLYGDPLMKRPLRYRTMGAVREGRGNPSPYSISGSTTQVALVGVLTALTLFKADSNFSTELSGSFNS